LFAFSQESTRYCNYGKDKFDNEVKVIKPEDLTSDQENTWLNGVEFSEKTYFSLLNEGCRPEIARDMLPTCVATKITVTGNPRTWRHILLQRTHLGVHPKFRRVSIPLLQKFKDNIPILYDDIIPNVQQSFNLRLPQ
jgi:thymidylate synthase (FAD)